jgi:hypothetical protein
MPVILATRKAEIRKISFQGQPRQKSSRGPSSTNKKLGVVMHTCPPCYGGSINRRIVVYANLGIKARPFPQNN